MVEIESMEEMAKRLRNCGSGAQARAVKNAVRAIRRAGGCLDEDNGATALYHLAIALSGRSHAKALVQRASHLDVVFY